MARYRQKWRYHWIHRKRHPTITVMSSIWFPVICQNTEVMVMASMGIRPSPPPPVNTFFQQHHYPIGIKPVSICIYPFPVNDYFKMSCSVRLPYSIESLLTVIYPAWGHDSSGNGMVSGHHPVSIPGIQM